MMTVMHDKAVHQAQEQLRAAYNKTANSLAVNQRVARQYGKRKPLVRYRASNPAKDVSRGIVTATYSYKLRDAFMCNGFLIS
jgi:hypothetical protein